MFGIPGYSRFETIHTGRKHRVVSAVEDATGRMAALKMPSVLLPSGKALTVLEKEYEYLQRLDLPDIPHAARLIHTGRSVVVVMECFDFPTLKQAAEDRPLRLAEATDVAEKLARILVQLHARGIIHRDITPANILYERAAGRVVLIDFGSAIDMPQQSSTGLRPETVEGTVAYMSPEQTGRINRPVDFRSDFYSFGVTLYELLTGRRPFTGDDAGALIHSHLAVTPPAPSALDPAVPQALSDIAMKCLAKDAGDRYQGAVGLHADLHRCRADLERRGEIAPFPLGEADIRDRFQFPERIVGRDRELAALQDLYEQAGQGQSAVVLVRGVSGAGKTSLVQELSRAVAAKKGYVAYGKYDQYNRAVPFSGLIEALSLLIRQILSEGEARVASWKRRILAAVGQNGRVLCEVIPDLETLIGEQPPAHALDPVAARTRQGTLFRLFMEALGRRNHPLLLFLDDLQWIDAASLSLLELMGSLRGEGAILCIGAFRSNEVAETHPLAVTLAAMRKRQASIAEVLVGPLTQTDLRGYLAEMFRLQHAEVASLARALHAKTNGNPLFSRTLLTALYQDGHLRFDGELRRWIWDDRAVAAMPYADNVVEALQARLATLPAGSLELLPLGALIGNPFSLDALASLSGRGRTALARDLAPALAQGLLTSPRRDVELYIQQSADRLEDVTFAFCHDRIQQAAYALLEETRKPALHLAAGRLVWHSLPPGKDDNRLFDVLEHMRKGAPLLTDPGERLRVAELALAAGRKAKTATAFTDATGMLDFARALLPEAPWESDYPLWRDISLDLAQSLYLAGRYDEAEIRCAEIRAHAATDRDRLRLFNVQAKQYHHQARYAEAVELEYRALELLGFEIPHEDDALLALFEAEKAHIGALIEEKAGGDPAALYDQPEATAPDHILAQEMLFDLYADSYLIGRGLVCAAVSAVMARLAMDQGKSPLASVAYIHYASTLCAMGLCARDYRTGHALGSLAARLAEHYAVPALQNYTYHVFSLAVNHWINPLASSHGYWFEASRLALASGSPYSGYVYLQLAHVQLASGAPLGDVEAQAARSLEFLRASGMDGIVTLLRLIVGQPLRHLRGKTRSIASLDDKDFDGAALAEQFASLPFFLGSLRYSQLRVACLANTEEALPPPETLHGWIDVVDATQQGQIMLADSWFFYTLLLLEHARRAGGKPQGELGARIALGHDKLRLWAELCPANFRHKLLLAEAERLAGPAGDSPDLARIIDTYDQAIDAALQSAFVQDAAMAAEKAGRFWLRRGKPHLAKAYFEQALSYYDRWGATGKGRHLRQAYGTPLADIAIRGNTPLFAFQSLGLETSSGTFSETFSEGLDLLSVIKATQAISRHMVMDDLGRELTAIATENAGATKGVLIRNKDGRLVVANVIMAGDQAPLPEATGEETPVELSPDISPAVVNFVARTRHLVILNDQADPAAPGSGLSVHRDEQATLFYQCPYLAAKKPASLCCLPIILQNEVRGLLYLENAATRGAFRKDRLQLLNILAGQAAISMENARVYNELNEMNCNLETLVRARTAELHAKNKELNRKNLALQRLSTTDQLTGVYNRRSIEDRLRHEIEHCRDNESSLAIILLDVDCFKDVNDTFGHNVGDTVLVDIAVTIGRNVRSTDFFGRWGGEEFMVVVSEFVSNVLPFAERLRKVLEKKRHPTAGKVTASLGVALYLPGETPSQFVSRADQALYRAKENGRNRVELAV
ncbi:serine/threonine protein kinase [Solidesulfovibrio fructosivorans JJ]]|uniref:Serine/threonine protein kinase n=1 Tax=Solidesulfovibrio fructosivorans JJ] TaxID=596151 RepID=E1JSX3_SOLFR|nr:diguanylate cyclase [Solidesulfovibrio fructosivorans]EFL52606.1 serine/threonine protein kinase [Solidesulfovibrio fructosivorans JJ]]